MKRRSRALTALLGAVLFGLVACYSPTGPEDREPKDDSGDSPKAEQSVVAGADQDAAY